MGDKVKVLVVDDDRRMVRTICDILRVKGYEAVPAYSGEEGVDKVKGESFDCVLMDIKMPGIDGVEALQMIRKTVPELPVVLMSAYATGEQAAGARQNGAYSILAKPLDVQVVLSFLSLLGKEERVLVVDDDPVFCKTLKDILQTQGYQVETETEPGNVLRRMERNEMAVVVLDLKLGAVDGLEVLRQIRARFPTESVVLVTGYGAELGASIAKVRQIGAYACLFKPFEADKLIGIIKEISQNGHRALLDGAR